MQKKKTNYCSISLIICCCIFFGTLLLFAIVCEDKDCSTPKIAGPFIAVLICVICWCALYVLSEFFHGVSEFPNFLYEKYRKRNHERNEEEEVVLLEVESTVEENSQTQERIQKPWDPDFQIE